MSVKHLRTFLMTAALICAGNACAQDMVAAVADMVIHKYQSASCADLAAQKNQPPSKLATTAIAKMKAEPKLRKQFIDLVAAPIANKLFECGMVP